MESHACAYSDTTRPKASKNKNARTRYYIRTDAGCFTSMIIFLCVSNNQGGLYNQGCHLYKQQP